jgi:thiol-disulfide isomerase/thioredoxin
MGKQRQNKKRRQHLNPPAWVGIGLLILGVASLIFLTNNKSTSAAASELSVTPMEVNFPAPQLALQNLQGETQSLEDFRGDVVLVNNWATWCPPCKAEMPSLKKFHDTHADAGFTVIAVDAGEGLDDVLAFAKGYELTFLVWLDPKQESLTVIRNGSLPNSYVIDRTGTVRLAWTGEISLTMLEKYVTPIIEENN